MKTRHFCGRTYTFHSALGIHKQNMFGATMHNVPPADSNYLSATLEYALITSQSPRTRVRALIKFGENDGLLFYCPGLKQNTKQAFEENVIAPDNAGRAGFTQNRVRGISNAPRVYIQVSPRPFNDKLRRVFWPPSLSRSC